MSNAKSLALNIKPNYKKKLLKLGREIILNRWIYLMIAPTIILLILFNYVPMYGVQLAFKEYKIRRGIWGSAWLEPWYKNFETFFNSYYFGRLISNTFLLSLFSLIFSFPVPIFLAIVINSIRRSRLKRFTQTVIYVPHFISTVVLAGMLYIFLSPTNGLVNKGLEALGMDKVFFMNDADWFRPVYILSGIWQGAGWGSILYIAGLAGVDPELYEASTIDGANQFHKVRYIEWPAILPLITLQLIMACGGLLNSNTEKTLLLQTPGNLSTSDVIGTYVYNVGIGDGLFSYTSAIGLFTTVINFILIMTVNKVADKLSGNAMF